MSQHGRATLKGLRNPAGTPVLNWDSQNLNLSGQTYFATLSGLGPVLSRLPRVAALARINPGLEVVNAFGVHVRDAQHFLNTQVCHCRFNGLLCETVKTVDRE